MSDKKIAVIGAGITGLTAAYSLKKKGFNVDVFEQHAYAGGAIRSVEQDGWLMEYGPNTLLLKDKIVADFIREVGALDKVIQANELSSKRYIVKKGQLVPIPTSFFGAIGTPLFSTAAKLRILKEPFIPKTNNRNETVAEFVERRLGREILDYALNPFIAGVYANRPENLSLRHAFPAMYELEQIYGSLIWGTIAGRKQRKKKGRVPSKLISFSGGLQQLVDTITEQFGDIHYNHEVNKIQKADNSWSIQNKFGNHGPYDKVIVNIPLYNWTEDLLPIIKKELEILKEVEYPPLSIFHIGFRKVDVSHPLDGFGFLVPEKEDLNILGALFSSTLFPGRAPEGYHLLTVFVGGGRQPELAQKGSHSLLKIILDELRLLLGINGEPVFKEHVFWPKSIPGYHVGYDRVLQSLQSIEDRNPGLFLVGNFREGISVPDCIKNGIALSERISEN